MGLKEAVRGIGRFVGDKPAFIEIVAGPEVAQSFVLKEDILVAPLGYLGNARNIEYGAAFLKVIGLPFDEEFLKTANEQGRQHFSRHTCSHG